MKRLISAFLLVLAALLYTSCQPSADRDGDLLFGIKNPETTGNGGGNNSNTKLIKKVTATASDGTVTTQEYIYDDKILTSVNLDDDGEVSTILVTYDGGGKISKLLATSENSGTIVTTDTVLNYGNGLLKGSTSSTNAAGIELNKSASIYSYTGDKLNKIQTVISQQDQSGNYTPFSTNITDITFGGNNISAFKSTLTVAPLPGSPIQFPPIISQAILSNYDANKNPFATLPKEFNIAQAEQMSGTASVTGLSLNNYGKATATANGSTIVVSYIYIYDANGYPTKATSSEGTLQFEYVN